MAPPKYLSVCVDRNDAVTRVWSGCVRGQLRTYGATDVFDPIIRPSWSQRKTGSISSAARPSTKRRMSRRSRRRGCRISWR